MMGWFGSFLGVGVDTDVDVSADVSSDVSAVIPFSVMCLCLFFVVFGALGHIAKLFM